MRTIPRGALAPGHFTPTSDNARWQAGVEENEKPVSQDCAAGDHEKHAAGLTARAALLGIEAHRLANGAWLLRHANSATIGTVQGVEALGAAVAGFEGRAARYASW